MSVNRIISAILNQSNRDAMYSCVRSAISAADWRAALLAVAEISEANPWLSEHLHTCWAIHGGGIRERVDDDVALVSALRKMLPTYTGPALQLYRGENAQRMGVGRIGLCWTPARETAAMFARGLNAAFDGGGVLLSAIADPHAIIAAPGCHSTHLGEREYTVDPAALENVAVLAAYPRSI